LSTRSLLTETKEKKKKAVSRLNRNSKLFKVILNAILEKKGEGVISLDLRKIPEAVADFFIVCEGGSSTQIKAIADFVEKEVKDKVGEIPYRREGVQSLQWVLVDYVNIVIHLFHPDARKFYRLEEMWSDAEVLEHH
jgi:ribosome-associated protein